jgi:tetratricopeptide (TPR) repeat protein
LRGESTVALTGRSLDDFLPGMRLADVRLDYRIKSPDEPMKVVGHVEQMRLSACYIKSDTLTCTTCHDMHAPLQPEEAIGFYRQRCLDCHAEQDCGLATPERLKQNPHDNCAACHMPQVETDIPHIAFTHHRIGFHFPAALEPESDAASSAGAGELVAYGDVSHVSGTEQARCLGLAYLEAYSKSRGRRESDEYGRLARQLLESALAQEPADGEVAAALAKLDWLENPPRALEMAQKALSDPRTSSSSRVNALFIAANVLFENNQSEAAMAPLQELTRLRRIAEDHLLLAACQAEAGEFADAEKTALTSLQIDPFRADVHELLARLAERQGNAAAAKTYQQTAEKLQAVPK